MIGASVTSAVATTGVTRLIPTATSNATRCNAVRRSGPYCVSPALSDTGSAKQTYAEPIGDSCARA